MIMGRLIGAILLVAGTTIGAGMLAMPVTTGLAGFFPSVFLMLVVWLYMLVTALLFLEVNLRMPGESNIISMVKKTLGKPGEIASWITYLLLLYSLTAAYIVGSSKILEDFVNSFLSYHIPGWVWPFPILLLFGLFVYLGTKVVDFLNRFLMVGLVLSYLILIVLDFPYIDSDLLSFTHYPSLLGAVPVIFTSFGYHIIIPTLSTYLHHNTRKLKLAIVIGSLIPFIVYLLWQLVSLGIVPLEGENGLKYAIEQGLPVTSLLNRILGNPWITIAARFFAFFAIITSFLGVALSLSDFLADGLKIEKTKSGRLIVALLTFAPPMMFAIFYPEGFIAALNYAGIFVAILLGLIPCLMAWYERYVSKMEKPVRYQAPGGKPLLITGILFSLAVIALQILY